ncbi:putative transcriptional regulator [Desulfosporosinus acidiphilus SJ4]|uniref:Putative transcriptional regulator n=1 Tax=Desulfosporosinus acidiphilus (strain DSM 22704 / JCM 16185 / SJ4) TaxID=646529 RepID=I4D231_DESAJ|nr:MerR family transcriptional regulator [Desulfosporosinus acidiphilus]AFM39855.1 putative transcriptional regulator [Desulfosporosinus acidiphilus SJ4]
MNISKLSALTGVSVRSLRYYEAKGILRSERLENGYRDFQESAVDRVKLIQLYLGLGLSSNEIAHIIDCPVSISDQKPLCEKAIKAYQSKLAEVENQIEILQKLRLQLYQRISNYVET